MRYLIDTNVLILYILNTDELTTEVKDILYDYGNRIYIPSKCVEELIFLLQSGKIEINRWKSTENIIDNIMELDIGIKYTAEEHLRTLARLPLFPDHKDPTDRVIIAQAITEKTPIISSDRKFQDYRRHGLNLVFNRR
jgi:PIN domain nuclease of toxin-antitoxin system